MQRLPSRGKSSKAQTVQTVRSFTRYEASAPSPTTRSRSNTAQDAGVYASKPTLDEAIVASPDERDPPLDNDIFERPDDEAPDPAPTDEGPSHSFAQGYDELPIEIQSLMERFLESLALKSHPTPLTMDRLAELYQDFYDHAHTHINTHISALSARLSRDQSPSPSASSGRSATSRNMPRKNSRPLERAKTADDLSTETQMLTVSEISDKRKARRQLELMHAAMEEAVERGVCEKVYPRIWRHSSTNDEARDEKLRSRAAALSLVGVDLKELLSTALSENVTVSADVQSDEINDETSTRNRLSNARKSLEDMNTERYPLGKLNHLFAAHKHIVEALQQMFPSSSSADEVLPTLIYTIITSQPESNNVVSNLNFIQRFRKADKIDGEAAYCLTNIEAAITFLETVDLSSIRQNEGPHGPLMPSSRPSTPLNETQESKPDPLYRGLPGNTASPAVTQSTSSSALAPETPQSRSRSLSSVIAAKQNTLEAAVMSSANAAFDDIHHALDGGFKFLFGRLREKQAAAPHNSPKAAAPKTLEDARKIVNPSATEADDASIAESAILDVAPDPIDEKPPKPDDKALATVPDSAALRRPSVQSVESSKPSLKAPVTAVESMRSLGSTLNPLKGGFPGMGMMRGFGSRSTTPATGVSTNAGVGATASSPAISPLEQPAISATVEDKAAATPAFSFDSVGPPIQRFVEVKDPRELNFFDVELLLRDYQRLAGAMNAARSAGGN